MYKHVYTKCIMNVHINLQLIPTYRGAVITGVPLFPHQEGCIGSGDSAVWSDKGRLEFGHLLRSGDTDTIVC